MAWFAELAGKAENILVSLDEQTGAAIRNTKVTKNKKVEKHEYGVQSDPPWIQKKTSPKLSPLPLKKASPVRNEIKLNVNGNKQKKPPNQIEIKVSPKQSDIQRYKRTPAKRSIQQFNLNDAPATLVSDIKTDSAYKINKARRFSLPADLMETEDLSFQLQNLEVENTMIRNELNVVNKEVSELLGRLRKTEDDLKKALDNIEQLQFTNLTLKDDNESLKQEVLQLSGKLNECSPEEIHRCKNLISHLETKLKTLKETNTDLEKRLIDQEIVKSEAATANLRLEAELRHAQNTVNDLDSNLKRSKEECQRMEKDWEAYKLRVKNMLATKDKDIKKLQEGQNLTEDTKILIEEIESLKEQREEMTLVLESIRGEYNDLKFCIDQLETKSSAADRLVVALREALKEERLAKNKIESEYLAVTKEFKEIQIETGQTIASLRAALHDKEYELNNLRETASASTETTGDSSTLNVADYDLMKESDRNKIQHLTQTLVMRQNRIDELLAENNMYKIQMEKMETKYKNEIKNLTDGNSYSIVNVDNDGKLRCRNFKNNESPLKTLSVRLGLFIRRYPIFRLFIILYMVGLHLWVMTVLFANTETISKRGG